MKFEIRKQYKNGDGVFTCVKRSSKNVWFRDEKGYVFKRSIFISPRTGDEVMKMYYHILEPSMTPEGIEALSACLAFLD